MSTPRLYMTLEDAELNGGKRKISRREVTAAVASRIQPYAIPKKTSMDRFFGCSIRLRVENEVMFIRAVVQTRMSVVAGSELPCNIEHI